MDFIKEMLKELEEQAKQEKLNEEAQLEKVADDFSLKLKTIKNVFCLNGFSEKFVEDMFIAVISNLAKSYFEMEF